MAVICFVFLLVFDFVLYCMGGSPSWSLFAVCFCVERFVPLFVFELGAFWVALGADVIFVFLHVSIVVVFFIAARFMGFVDPLGDGVRGFGVNAGVCSSVFVLVVAFGPLSLVGEATVAGFVGVADLICGFLFRGRFGRGGFARLVAFVVFVFVCFVGLVRFMLWISVGGGVDFAFVPSLVFCFAGFVHLFVGVGAVDVFVVAVAGGVFFFRPLAVFVFDTLVVGHVLGLVDGWLEALVFELLMSRFSFAVRRTTCADWWMVWGDSCLAGAFFCVLQFGHAVHPGDRLSLRDAWGSSVVASIWFLGVILVFVVVFDLFGILTLVRVFCYVVFFVVVGLVLGRLVSLFDVGGFFAFDQHVLFVGGVGFCVVLVPKCAHHCCVFGVLHLFRRRVSECARLLGWVIDGGAVAVLGVVFVVFVDGMGRGAVAALVGRVVVAFVFIVGFCFVAVTLLDACLDVVV
ncbi:carboxynorspermidine decarboxylase [Pacificibacter marinus]|nr:carboxynorspermidine decarboxylase [Pacificibacter marinus]